MTPKETGFKLAYAHYEGESCRFEDADRLALEIAKEIEAAAGDQDATIQIKEARKLLEEFTTNQAVCQALGPTCMGGHQEDPCKCLYCRTRHQLSMMD